LCLADNTIADFFTTLTNKSEAAQGGNRERCSRESYGIAFPSPSKEYACPQKSWVTGSTHGITVDSEVFLNPKEDSEMDEAKENAKVRET
jgi:hypothetical protein